MYLIIYRAFMRAYITRIRLVAVRRASPAVNLGLIMTRPLPALKNPTRERLVRYLVEWAKAGSGLAIS